VCQSTLHLRTYVYSYHQVHTKWCTYTSTLTVLLLSGGPDAAQEVSVEFEEDLREEFLQHAILTLFWESPAS